MSSKTNNPRNHVVYSDSELNEIRKYLKDIAMISNMGGYPQYEIGKVASIINVGGETVEHYFGLVK